MNLKRLSSVCFRINSKAVLITIAMGIMLIMYGCGSDSSQTGATASYPTGISEDVEQQLKYDARVDGFDTGDGDSLVVTVNDAWLNSPQGMQERSLGQWYTLWHANHKGGVVVQHDGNKIASWTSEHGYKPEPKEAGEQQHAEG